MAKIILTLTEEQAKIVSLACEFYARVRMGQFEEILFKCLDFSIPYDEYCNRMDAAERLLLEARKEIYPDLNGIGCSYGYGKFKDSDTAFDVYLVIRENFRGYRGTFSFYGFPKCEKVEE